METRTEENPWKNFQPLQSYCCLSAALLSSMSHLCNGTGVEGKPFSLPRPRGITSPEQWLVTLSPDWSQMTFLPKITPDDTPGGFSMQLVIEYSLYSKSWLYGYGRTLHCQSLSVSLDTVRREWDILSNCSLQLSTLSDQNIKKIPHDCPM